MKKGFTLIEILLVLALIGIISSIAFFMSLTSYDKARYLITIKKMDAIVKGFIGDEDLVEGGSRVSFGYLGDTNAWPRDRKSVV